MPLTLGSVTVSDAGIVTKSGECGALYDILDEAALYTLQDFNPALQLPTGPEDAFRRKAQARQATALATYFYGLLTARATAKISTATGALQRAGGVDTTAPTVDKFLPIV